MTDSRFSRMQILYGADACKKFSSASVLVCGLGAVGGFAVEALARSGVSNFILADADTFEETNIGRQIGALNSTLGMRKTQVMKSRILDINPKAKVEFFDLFLDEETIPKILSKKPDLIVDAIDTIKSKVALIKFAFEKNFNLVSSMGAARKLDISKIKTAPLNKTSVCPLAFKIRKDLRKFGLSPKFNCVFSEELVSDETHLASASLDTKKIIGSAAAITGIFGFMLADLSLREILKNVK